MQGKIKVCVVNPPVYGDQVLPFLEDLAAVSGGKVVSQSLPADKVDESYLGFVKKAVVTSDSTVIQEGAGDKSIVKERIAQIKRNLQSDRYTKFQKERMEMRLSKLQGKIGIIKVGGATETEKTEMKFRVEDAVHATRAAQEEGIVPGGGVTLAQISTQLETELKDDNETQGFMAVVEALREPFKQLMINAGEDPGYRLKQVMKAKKGYGFNVKDMREDPTDLIGLGVIDPTKVIKSVVENACSVAGIGITLKGSVIIDRDWQLEQVQLNKNQ